MTLKPDFQLLVRYLEKVWKLWYKNRIQFILPLSLPLPSPPFSFSSCKCSPKAVQSGNARETCTLGRLRGARWPGQGEQGVCGEGSRGTSRGVGTGGSEEGVPRARQPARGPRRRGGWGQCPHRASWHGASVCTGLGGPVCAGEGAQQTRQINYMLIKHIIVQE